MIGTLKRMLQTFAFDARREVVQLLRDQIDVHRTRADFYEKEANEARAALVGSESLSQQRADLYKKEREENHELRTRSLVLIGLIEDRDRESKTPKAKMKLDSAAMEERAQRDRDQWAETVKAANELREKLEG